MIYLHETHEISGGRMADFQTAIQEMWRPLVERGGGARLLWFWDHGHGTGPSYQAIAVTAVRDWATWGQLVDRLTRHDDGRAWSRAVAPLRRRVTGKLLVPVAWSPLQTVDLEATSRTADTAEPEMHLHDTGWPYPGFLEDYVQALGAVFHPQTLRSRMIAIEACWQTCPGTGQQEEVLLLQRILDWDAFARLLSHGESGKQRGGWMEEGLRYRDRWESKLLRTATWSPRP